MTKEELETEANKYADNYATSDLDCSFRAYMFDASKEGYLAGAEPREKHIAEVETRCNELFLQTCEQAEKITELELKIKHLTENLEPQTMTALFKQVEEEVRLEQRVKELEWHDLEKNPNDLPRNRRDVWCDYGEGYGKGCYSKDDGGWWIEGHMFYSAIDAWCELQKRNKGDKR